MCRSRQDYTVRQTQKATAISFRAEQSHKKEIKRNNRFCDQKLMAEAVFQ
jgi:hypothetical protein